MVRAELHLRAKFQGGFGGGRIYKPINLRADGSTGGERKSPREKEGSAESVARIYGGRRKKQKQRAVEFLFSAVAGAFRQIVRLAAVSRRS